MSGKSKQHSHEVDIERVKEIVSSSNSPRSSSLRRILKKICDKCGDTMDVSGGTAFVTSGHKWFCSKCRLGLALR